MNRERTARKSRTESVQGRPWWPRNGVSTKSTPGFVYFVQADSGGLVKIGWATKPAARVKNMQMVCPVRLLILLSVAGSGDTEGALHKRFAEHRRHGEWFEPVPEIFALIEEWRASPPPTPNWPAPPPKPTQNIKPKPVPAVQRVPRGEGWLKEAMKALE